MRQKSAKDLAFDQERAKMRKSIRELEYSLKECQKQVVELNEVIAEKDELIRQQEDWINRLLEYTEMPKDELRKLLDNEKESEKFREHMLGTLGFIGAIGRRYSILDDEGTKIL